MRPGIDPSRCSHPTPLLAAPAHAVRTSVTVREPCTGPGAAVDGQSSHPQVPSFDT